MRALLCLALLSPRVLGAAPDRPFVITLDGRAEGRTFEGIGACSAGGSSRLLIDYPEPSRARILDLLFRPQYGAGFQHLKVEIGGDVNSTAGCEPSHQHDRSDEDYGRGWEWWLMQEAIRRNPAIALDCLAWGAPAWIGGGRFYSQDSADYIARFIQGARSIHGLAISSVGIWNETLFDPAWITQLRRTLDGQRLGEVRIVAADQVNRWTIVDALAADPALARCIDVVGVHYPNYRSPLAAQHCGKSLWASEDGPWRGDWEGAKALARIYNRNYIEGRMTKTIIWSPVTSYYDNLPLPGSGTVRANTPWSGAFEVEPALWATAHTTQFVQPGWRYLESDGCGPLPGGGSYVTLKSTNQHDYSVIVETTDATTLQTVLFRLKGGLSSGPVHIWRTSPIAQFIQVATVRPALAAFTIQFEPCCIYSLTTTSGQLKGSPPSPPPRPFPESYGEDFEGYAAGRPARFWSDQGGIFEVAPRPDGAGQCLVQRVREKGIEWHSHPNPFPESFLGEPDWEDYEVRVDTWLEGSGFVSLFGRVGSIPKSADPPHGYCLKVTDSGEWTLSVGTASLASGRLARPETPWRPIGLRFAGTNVTVLIDDRAVAEVADSTCRAGMVGIGSGWHQAAFDDFAIQRSPRRVGTAHDNSAASSRDGASGRDRTDDH